MYSVHEYKASVRTLYVYMYVLQKQFLCLLWNYS